MQVRKFARRHNHCWKWEISEAGRPAHTLAPRQFRDHKTVSVQDWELTITAHGRVYRANVEIFCLLVEH